MKRRLITVSVILLILCLLTAAAGAEDAGTNDRLYAKQAEDGLWGYSDAVGKWVIPAQYQDADDFRGNYARVCIRKDDGYIYDGIINRSGEFVLQPEYDIEDGYGEGFGGFGTWDDGYYIVWQVDRNDDKSCGFFDVPSGFFSGLKYENVLDTYGMCDLIPVSEKRDGTEYMGFADRTTGELVLPYQYWISTEYFISAFHEGVEALAPMTGQDEETGDAVPGKFELVKTDGGIIQLPDGISAVDGSRMSEGLIEVMDDSTGLFGYADINGNVVIKPAYAWASVFVDGKAKVELTEDNYALIDREGKIVLLDEDEQFTVIMAENAGTGKPRYAFRGENGLFGYIDEQGQVVMPPQFIHADDFAGDYAEVEVMPEVSIENREGLINTNGEWVLHPDKSAWLKRSDDGLYILGLNGKCGFLDIETGFFSGYLYDDVIPQYLYGYASDGNTSSLIRIKIDGKTGFADRKTGGIRIPCQYEAADDFARGYATVTSPDGQTLLIDENGKEYIAPEGTTIDGNRFSDGLCVVQDKESGLYGYMDMEGKLVIPAEYSSAYSFDDETASVRKDNVWYEITPEGQLKVAPKNTETRWYISENMDYIQQEDNPDTLAVFGEGDTLLFTVTVPNLKYIKACGADGVLWYEIEDPEGKDYETRHRYGLMSDQGDILTGPLFSRKYSNRRYADFCEGLCAVTDVESGKAGYIDAVGNWVIPPRYKEAESFINGRAWVTEGRPAPFGSYGWIIYERKLINQAGEVLFTETVPDTGEYEYEYY